MQELRGVLTAHPTRQRLVGLLMRALHACGRTAEALEAFAEIKELLADSLGADPDRELVALHTAILRDRPAESAVAAAAAPPVPAMLPRATPRFTGRQNEIRALDRFLMDAGNEAGLAAVTGMGGIGKTALAVRWAHRVAHRFPDGQLYFNLRGFDPVAPRATPAEVLGEALAALGVAAGDLPSGLDERAGLYRTLLARRRVLIVLDDARDAAHVRPLLATAPGSFTIVTSRDRLFGLDVNEGAEVVHLGLLSDVESKALLARRIGPDRAVADGAAVDRIAAACGRFPLALTLAGSRAAADPGLALGALADRLASADTLLGALSSPDFASDPRTLFDGSYQLLEEREALAFCLFGLHSGPELTPAATASLMGVGPAQARAALTGLAAHSLVDRLPGDRYSMHGLLRDYAAECLADEILEADRRAAALRMLEHYLHAADRAARLLSGGGRRPEPCPPAPGVHSEPIEDAAAAAAWFEAERPVLRALLRVEAGFRTDRRVWRLARILTERTAGRPRGRELMEIQKAALSAAERCGDTAEQAVSLAHLAIAALELGEADAARERSERSGALAERAGDQWAQGFAAYARALVSAEAGRGAEAAGRARAAARCFREAGDRSWEHRAARLAERREAVSEEADRALLKPEAPEEEGA